MSFQQKVLSSKNQITLISGILIVIGFIARLGFGNMGIFNVALIIASILGVAPIALQAISALKVKVVSIDVLVTIAVIGAFLIQNYEESAIVTFLFLFGSWLEVRILDSKSEAERKRGSCIKNTIKTKLITVEFPI